MIVRLQRDDPLVKKYRQRNSVEVRGDQEILFEEKKMAYCIGFTSTPRLARRQIRQIIVPKSAQTSDAHSK